jgi:hypothetical protein
MGRSEMWRLKQHLTNSCVYVNKKIEYCESIRCQGQFLNNKPVVDVFFHFSFSL